MSLLAAAVGSALLAFAGHSLAVRKLQNQAEQTAVWRAIRLRDSGIAFGHNGAALPYSRTIVTLPPEAVLAHDRGGVRVVVRARRVVPRIGAATEHEVGATAVILPRVGAFGSQVAVVR